MCGIAGVLSPAGRMTGDALAEVTARMGARLRLRGPDASGEWVDAAAGIGFAHRRLSIQDLSEAGAQPMASASGRYVITYNGEVYNGAEIRAELEPLGQVFRGHSDTEAILAGFAEWGLEATLARMVGMFAFALWDRETRELTLVRDRMGIKPVYWCLQDGAFWFASELKGVLEGLGQAPAIDSGGLGAFLRLGQIPAPLTIHRGIRKLEPGRILRFRSGGQAEITRYWRIEDEIAEAARDRITDPVEARGLIEQALGEAVRMRLIADVPLGAFLSGGIDSSLITALMVEQSAGTVSSYSIGSPSAGYDEAGFAREVAARLGTRHTELVVGDRECLDAIAGLMEVYDEPFADSSQVPTLLLSRLTRQHVTVALSGDGGDELFAGYNRYLWQYRLARARASVPAGVLKLGANLAAALPPGLVDGAVGLAGYSGVARRIGKLSAMASAASVEEAHAAVLAQWNGLGPTAERPATLPAPDELIDCERMQFRDLQSYLPDDILTKVDRASMAHALEVRVPFLDHRVVRAAFRLAPDLKLRDGTTKWILRQMLHDRISKELVDRPKQGFAIPIEAWLRSELRNWAEGLIDGTDWAGLGVEPGPIREAWDSHLSGRRDQSEKLWTVLMLASWAAP